VLLSRRSDFVNGLITSLVVATASTAIVLVIGTLAAYSLYRFRWARWIVAGLLGWMLAFHVIPVITMVGPWYLVFKELGLYDTRTALILTHVAINLPMAVWLMMSFFKGLPPEIEEAALVDGCRRYRRSGV
jgi:multiple sugar transport system permease protein